MKFIPLYLLLVILLPPWQSLWGETAPEQTVLSGNYILRPSDLIQVRVFQEPDLDKQVRIEADGTVVLPLVRRVKIGGLTVAEAQDLIYELFDRDFLVNPQISILVIEFRMRKVDVLGQVNAPGPIDIPPDRELTLVEAVSRAKGFTRLARRGSVQVTRTDASGEKQVITLNADRMMGDSEESDFILQDGDSVFVPERLL